MRVLRVIGFTFIAGMMLTAEPVLASIYVEAEDDGSINNTFGTAEAISAASFTTPPPSGVLMPWATATVLGTGGMSTGDVDFYSFTTLGGGALFDIDIADFTFDTILSLFNSDGTLIAFDDDAGSEPGSASGSDSYIGRIPLAPGTYYIAVSEHANFATATSGPTIPLFRPDGGDGGSLTPGRPFGVSTFVFGSSGVNGSDPYTLHISLEPVVDVPEPSSLALLSIGGIGMVIGAVRRRRQKTAV